MNPLDALWEPVRIGPVQTRNRIYLPAHQVSLPPPAYGAYLAERARGGVGLIVTHGFHVHPASARAGVSPWEPAWADAVQAFVQPSKRHGVPVFVQVTHMGASGTRRTDDIDHWGAVMAPSPLPSPVHRAMPKPMEEEDIREVIAGFAATCANVQAGGGDGVEIHGSHGYLVSNFLSPYWNRRDDAWGGDTERRARLALEIGKAVRQRCGSEFVVGIKLSLDEYLGEAGTTPRETVRVVQLLEQARLFDYVCLSHTDYHQNHKLVPPQSSGETAPLAAGAAPVRAALAGRIPLLIQGSVRSIEKAAEIVQRGQSDLVGLVRAHIADPEIVRKAQQGRAEETRRCVGANQGCWRRLGQNVSCTVNPVAGRELQFGAAVVIKPPAGARRVLVIGGGPAGLKFADTAAARGHRVTLWERSGQLGGQIRKAGLLPDYASWNFLVDDLEASVRRRGVEIVLHREATAAAVAAAGADEVVVATGARWQTGGRSMFRTDRDTMAGAELPHVMDVLSALDQLPVCGRRVLIVDDNGDYLPLGLARLLAATGREVTVVTADAMLGHKLEATLDWPWLMPRVTEAGVAMRASTRVDSIAPGHAILSSTLGGAAEALAADTVVLSMQRTSEDALYHQLSARGLPVRRIGDCVAPREVDDAVLEGFREAQATA
ncbi:oxidoreductase [Variovorax sp. PBL-E5]|uniref:oxidoreductase n=1 Tax=Variovorax sp. PBL-E5 TaxID=434014 RepID=UPI00131779A7|nr:FAD-dependent oxidoreductase [Variovorax sp. PBL-E5]VTU27132.1 putative N-methylproline demethylase [Variovorax sp. PBL-E5]